MLLVRAANPRTLFELCFEDGKVHHYERLGGLDYQVSSPNEPLSAGKARAPVIWRRKIARRITGKELGPPALDPFTRKAGDFLLKFGNVRGGYRAVARFGRER